MQVRYVGMFDAVEVPALSPDPAHIVVEVERGEVAAVPAGPDQLAVAKGLLIQESNWEAVDAEAKAALRAALAEREAQLRARGISPGATVAEAAATGTADSVFESAEARGGKKTNDTEAR